MFGDLKKYPWVLQPVLSYQNIETLTKNFKTNILNRVWEKHKEIQKWKSRDIETVSIDQMLSNE